MSVERPEPPSGADSPEELAAYVDNNPSDWLMYLRHINGYVTALKEENDLLRVAESDRERLLQSLQSTISKQEGIIEYQKTQHRERLRLLLPTVPDLPTSVRRSLTQMNSMALETILAGLHNKSTAK